jgi:GYF domain 2/Sel1 repeat
VSDTWYYADADGQVGPLTLQELRQELATFSKANDVLVWCEGFPDWKPARDVTELRAVPPPLPRTNVKAKRPHDPVIVRGFLFLGIVAVAAAAAAISVKKPNEVESLLRAANQGVAEAQNDLGIMYENGSGVAQDYPTAVAWYHKAADQGFAIAQYNLGTMYEYGEGVPKDDAEAVRWYRKAADQGDADAKEQLAAIYARFPALRGQPDIISPEAPYPGRTPQQTQANGAKAEHEANRAIRGDLLGKSAVQTGQEISITLKKGETLGAILRDLGATPEEIKAIAAVLGPRGRDGNLQEGQKIRVLVSPVRGPNGEPLRTTHRQQPVRVTLVGETAIEAVVALSDLGKYVGVDVQSAETQVADADELVPLPTMPEVEKLLIAAVERARAAYATGANEMAQGAARPARAKEICARISASAIGSAKLKHCPRIQMD